MGIRRPVFAGAAAAVAKPESKYSSSKRGPAAVSLLPETLPKVFCVRVWWM